MVSSIDTIASYYTHQEHAVDFFGKELIVTETKTPSVIRRWISSVYYYYRRHRSNLVVGVGVQWTPSSYSEEADTLQLCVGKRCLIIKLTHCERVPRLLRRFLVDANITFVGVWNGQDAKKLAQSRHRLEIGEILDVKDYVRDSEGERLNGCSFEVIVEECLGLRGVRLEKWISMSDWSVDDLNLGQILQATIDAYVCFDLGVRFRLWGV